MSNLLKIEVSRLLIADLLTAVARSVATLKALSKLHSREEAKILIKAAHELLDIHVKITEEVYGIRPRKKNGKTG